MTPWSFTLAELVAMTAARRRDEWDRTATLAALVASAATGKRTDPNDFHPLRRRPRAALTAERLRMFAAMIRKRKERREKKP